MAVKVVTGKTRQRNVNVDFKSFGVLGYDADNAYPQRIRDVIQSSGVASSCTSMKQKYVFGSGATIAGIDAAKSINELIRACAEDFCMWNGFAVHVNYDVNGNPTTRTHVPFEMVRIGIDKKASMYGIHPNWDHRDPNKQFRQKDIIWVNEFSPNTVLTEINECEGDTIEQKMGAYKGQLFYYTTNRCQYPLAPIDPVLEDAITTSQIKLFKSKNIRTNFMASHMLVHFGKFENDTQRDEFIKSIEEFQGAERVGNVMVIEADDESQIPKLVPFTIQNNDKLWEYTEQSVIKAIVQNYQIPPVLIGILEAGKLGTSNEINDAHSFYTAYTESDRTVVAEQFSMLFGQPVFIKPKPAIFQTTPTA